MSIVSLPLRREALLPAERNRGLGTLAVVCTMAGVASGLALATTLMAMQVAHSMDGMGGRHGGRAQHYRVAEVQEMPGHGYFGTQYVYAHGAVIVTGIVVGSPAAAMGVVPGDRIVAVDGDRIDSEAEMTAVFHAWTPGMRPAILLGHGPQTRTVQPTLVTYDALR